MDPRHGFESGVTFRTNRRGSKKMTREKRGTEMKTKDETDIEDLIFKQLV